MPLVLIFKIQKKNFASFDTEDERLLCELSVDDDDSDLSTFDGFQSDYTRASLLSHRYDSAAPSDDLLEFARKASVRSRKDVTRFVRRSMKSGFFSSKVLKQEVQMAKKRQSTIDIKKSVTHLQVMLTKSRTATEYRAAEQLAASIVDFSINT